jgi:hypothetical protein
MPFRRRHSETTSFPGSGSFPDPETGGTKTTERQVSTT